MMISITAWRNLDGSYTLTTSTPFDDKIELWYLAQETREKILEHGGRWVADLAHWVVPESALEPLKAERIFIVILANFCCNGASYAEVRDRDVRRGKVFRVFCPTCGKRPTSSTLWEVPIIEFCGEGEEGQLTYEAAFQAEIER